MLQVIRDKAQGWIAWVIVILLSVPFALFGIQQYFEGGGNTAIAMVGDEEVPLRLYGQEYDQALARLSEQRSGQVTSEDELRLKTQVVDGLIEHALITQTVAESGYGISDKQLEEAVKANPNFQVNGKYSKQALESLLRYNGLTQTGYAAQEKQRMQTVQMQLGIGGAAIITDQQVDDLLKLEKQTRDFDQITLKADAFKASVQLDDAMVKAHYEANKDQYQAPEQLQVEYLDLNANELMQGKDLDMGEVRKYYDEHKDHYRNPERRKASHILIGVAADADEEARKTARNKVIDLETQLRDGADFAELAKANSMDSGSAPQGGDLGFVAEGDLDESVLNKIKSLKLDEVSEPIRSTYGWHLVKLTAVEGGDVKAFDEASKEIVEQLKMEKGEGRFFALGETLANTTYDYPDSLQAAADALEMPIKTSVWFHKDGPVDPMIPPQDLSHVQGIRDAAFSEEVLNDRVNSQVINIGDRRAVVLRVVDRKPQRQLSLEEVHEDIQKQLIAEKANELAQAKAEEIAKAVEGGADAKTSAEAAGAQFNNHTLVKRTDFNLSYSALKEAFRMPKPEAGSQEVSVVEGIGGEHHVVILKKINDADLSEITAEERKLLRSSVKRVLGTKELNAYLAYLRENSEVQIFEKNL